MGERLLWILPLLGVSMLACEGGSNAVAAAQAGTGGTPVRPIGMGGAIGTGRMGSGGTFATSDTGGMGSCDFVATSDAGGTSSGGNPTCAVTLAARRLAEDQGAPFAMAIDAANVYWTGFHIDPADYSVNKVSRNGETLEALVSHYEGGGRGIAVDAANVYFATGADVMKVPIAGGARSTLVAALDPDWSALAVDAASVYFTTTNAVMKLPLGGGASTVLASGQCHPSSIAVDATSVYFTTDTSVTKVPLDGSATTVLASEQAPRDIAIDATTAYFTTATSVMKVPLDGGASTTLASGQDGPCAVSVDATNVYWATHCREQDIACLSSNSCPVSSLMKLPLSGGTPTCVLSLGIQLSDFAIDGTNVYSVRLGPGPAQAYQVVETNTL